MTNTYSEHQKFEERTMKRIVLLSTIIVIFISSTIISQITLQVGAGGGYISPTGDYAG